MTKRVSSTGRAIEEIRKATGWTQRELADVWGVSVNFISQVENGRRGASETKIGELATQLGIPKSLFYVLGDVTSKEPVATLRNIILAAIAQRRSIDAGIPFHFRQPAAEAQPSITETAASHATPMRKGKSGATLVCFVASPGQGKAAHVKAIEVKQVTRFYHSLERTFLQTEFGRTQIGESIKQLAPSRNRAILSLDLVKFSAIAAEKGLSKAGALLENVRSMIHREVSRGAGDVVFILGDGCIAAFESPHSAMDAAVAIRHRLAHDFQPVQLSARMALESGTGDLANRLKDVVRITAATKPNSIGMGERLSKRLGKTAGVPAKSVTTRDGLQFYQLTEE